MRTLVFGFPLPPAMMEAYRTEVVSVNGVPATWYVMVPILRSTDESPEQTSAVIIPLGNTDGYVTAKKPDASVSPTKEPACMNGVTALSIRFAFRFVAEATTVVLPRTFGARGNPTMAN